jgi:hypothetical protein
MFFRNLLCTVTLATFASAAVAKQIPTPYTSEQSEATSEEILKREAEPEPARTAAWEEAHGGPAPTYKYGEQYGEEHDASAWHIAREANPLPEAEAEAEPGWANVGGHRQKKPGNWGHMAREAEPMAEAEAEAEPGWANVGGHRQHKPGNWASRLAEGVKKPFTKGGPAKFKNMLDNHARQADGPDGEDVADNAQTPGLLARDPRPEDLKIPDFGDQVVDTSLEGLLERRDAEDDDEDDGYDGEKTELSSDGSKADLSGYDAGVLQRRSDGTADEVDYSLEGYEKESFETEEEEKEIRLIQARDLAEDQVAADDKYLHSDEHKKFLASHGVTERSFADDLQDAEHDRIDARDANKVNGANVVPDFGDAKVETSLEGMSLPTRDVNGETDAPDYYGEEIDFSLEGYDEAVVQARGVADEEPADEKADAEEGEGEEGSKDSDADAAYANAEVVEEFFAPGPELA